jgi:hypothetical protein
METDTAQMPADRRPQAPRMLRVDGRIDRRTRRGRRLIEITQQLTAEVQALRPVSASDRMLIQHAAEASVRCEMLSMQALAGEADQPSLSASHAALSKHLRMLGLGRADQRKRQEINAGKALDDHIRALAEGDAA